MCFQVQMNLFYSKAVYANCKNNISETSNKYDSRLRICIEQTIQSEMNILLKYIYKR